MLCWEVELLATWRVQFCSHGKLKVVEDISLLCDVVFQRECNSVNFKDCERMVVELKDIMFRTLCGWMTTINYAISGYVFSLGGCLY
jgi:hypothetical protein